MIMAGKLAPALASGCTVIMKPSPETPMEAYIIAECAEEAGLPPGVINLVPGHREAADHLVWVFYSQLKTHKSCDLHSYRQKQLFSSKISHPIILLQFCSLLV
jgi:hypothetical protein